MTTRTNTAIALLAVVSIWVATTMTAAVAPDAQRRPTFAADIAPIVFEHCTPCHRPGTAAPFSMLSFDDVRAKGDDIVKATQSHAMPPWPATQGPGFPPLIGDRRLTEKQITAIKTWVANGMPSGDARRTPTPPSLPQSWPLGLPDLTIALPRTIGLAAGGPDELRNVVIPVGFPTDLWISAIDYQPGESGVLRHARFFAAPPDLVVSDNDVLPGVGGLLGGGSLENYGDQVLAAGRTLIDLGGWAPGIERRLLPNGLAMRLPPRTNIIMQMHVRPATIDTIEDGRLAIYFNKTADRRALIAVDVPPAFGIAADLSIPIGAAIHKFTDSFTLPIEVEAVGARGHAHDLGRDMTLTAKLPAGPTRGVLKIGQWNGDWPESYFFAAPLRLPKGSTLKAEITYDNSPGNPRNLFTPPRAIRWGRMSVGEMGTLTLLIVAPPEADAKALHDALAQHLRDQLLVKRRPSRP